MPDTITLRLGALAPPIERQIREQGFTANREKIRALQADMNAITRLRVRGLLPDAAARRAQRRVCDAVVRLCKNARLPAVRAALEGK